MSADRMERTDRDPETIRREIRRTRGEMDDTVDELVERLSVGNLVDEVWHRLRRSGSGGGVGTVLRDHPVPLALMGLGLGWMAVEQATGHSMSPSADDDEPRLAPRTRRPAGTLPSRTHDGDGMGYALEADEEDNSDGLKEKVSDATDRVKRKASDLAGTVSDTTSELSDRVSDTTSNLSHRASEKASQVASSLEDAGRKARRGMQHMLDENPLALGSILFGLGLASGLSLPSTRFEDRRVGDTADHLKEEAKQIAKQGAEKVKEAGKDVARTAREAGSKAAGTVLEETREKLEDTREAVRDERDEAGDERTGTSGSTKTSERAEGIQETTTPNNPAAGRRTTGMPGSKGRRGSHGTTDSGGFGGTSGGGGRGGL